ncbi:PRA1 family protein 2-like isoform X2 [Gordionus sp. m RMFG-2023]|uniref:PRA1 family protein 2-like isoform X2 n=1 Tax=Gordionus sp. m RMFG-2023 TaxID=3053472 RepID=UPI0031FCD1FE
MSFDARIPPIRPLNDFLFELSRFQLPNGKDYEKLNKRILNNLLYYQTNYFVTIMFFFLLVGSFAPTKMLMGLITASSLVIVFIYCTKNKYQAMQFKQNHPLICFCSIISISYLIIYLIKAVAVFTMGITLPVSLIIMHSSMRMRNIKNKLANTMENIGLKKSPMGIIMEGIGIDDERNSYFKTK